ncbi:glutamyl-tRNA synthetase [Bifidobacterium actinocoloniiforme DSM 22766]|uniref:Glutamate--tRNA ligase n=1 Tax=Bifidobacterium actinocoloniiforme DSM 22766 TaxID=1437605 RepID=A0A086Z1V6_9BIFI|nr:glutamate--tRNA ligase [Bifidobacterium actinocoloniiforme]AKV55607.1 glutamyl-tRNA synthetase [Bifidobacterium actinocoloniiforme DSM 22766]KFI40506.1 glutamyl-tRNA synthetase [Bifidobacterium actinocoloniiforme DSM 22766]
MSQEHDKNVKPELPKDLRVRFCPSPTGTPHVGMVRTALFNWAQARHSHGSLVFRIEDTDAARDSEESYEQILDAMRWLGLDWDEGVEVGGPYAPYRQSERGDIYRDVAGKLLEAGYAYESYSTAEEIEARNLAAGRPKAFGYDGFDRDLTQEQKAAFKAEGRKPALRIRMPDEDLAFDDLIRGRIEFKAGSVPDYVIVRPNGDPLYTLTNPTDDALMRINVVLRGEDLLSSTPRQLVLYRYLTELGIAEGTPLFGHMPYVMGQGKKKLSKRDPESNLFLHREHGFIREGLLNYLALLGWSIAPDRDVFSMDELVEHFDIRDVKANPAHFDIDKATAINAEHIRMLDSQDFLNRSLPYLKRDGVISADSWDALTERERTVLTAAAPLVQPRVRLLGEVSGMVGSLLRQEGYIEPAPDARKQLKDSAGQVLELAVRALTPVAEADWSAEHLHELLTKALVDEAGYKPGLAFGPVRVAVSGRRVSPPLFESLEIIGKDTTLRRLNNLRQNLG